MVVVLTRISRRLPFRYSSSIREAAAEAAEAAQPRHGPVEEAQERISSTIQMLNMIKFAWQPCAESSSSFDQHLPHHHIVLN